MFRRTSEAADRMRRRQEAEDGAPRLAAAIPSLRTLRLALRFRRGETRADDSSHIKIVVVASAPALFFIPCSDKQCRDGGHDISNAIMAGLREGRTTIKGEDACDGTLGSAQSRCTCHLTYEATATYG